MFAFDSLLKSPEQTSGWRRGRAPHHSLNSDLLMMAMAEPILSCCSCWEKDCFVGIPGGILSLWRRGLRGRREDVPATWVERDTIVRTQGLFLSSQTYIHCLSGWITVVILQMENKHEAAGGWNKTSAAQDLFIYFFKRFISSFRHCPGGFGERRVKRGFF